MIYRFDDFVLDTDKLELWRCGERVAVEPQVFALLRLLVERRERLVSKDELIEEIWDGRIVSDSALSSRVKSARQALGDDGAQQRWIRTLHGKGFRFVGEVDVEAGLKVEPGREPVGRMTDVMARPMVAVFPFEQEHPDPEQAYFVDGLAEDLIAELASWRWFPVLSRNAAFDPRWDDMPIAERAAALGARYAISGRIHCLGGAARLTIELVDVETGEQLWSARVERERDGLVAAQSQIAAEVFQRLSPELSSAERRRILRKAPADMTAWDITLKALWVLNQPSRHDFSQALEQLETATRLDPGLSLSWSLISLIRYESALKGWTCGELETVRAHLWEMLLAARRAVDIDPTGWMGHALASIGELMAGASYGAARAHADQAIDLNPSAALAHQFSGCIYGFGGDLQAALAVQGQATRIDPAYLRADVVEADMGLWRLLMGEFDEARRHLDNALAANPRNLRARQRMVALLGSLGECEAARVELDGLSALGAPLTPEYVAASYPFQQAEHARLFASGLRRAGVAMP